VQHHQNHNHTLLLYFSYKIRHANLQTNFTTYIRKYDIHGMPHFLDIHNLIVQNLSQSQEVKVQTFISYFIHQRFNISILIWFAFLYELMLYPLFFLSLRGGYYCEEGFSCHCEGFEEARGNLRRLEAAIGPLYFLQKT